MEEAELELFAAQLERLRDNLLARFERDESALAHHAELDAQHFKALWSAIERLEKIQGDHEARLRRVDDAVTALRSAGSLLQAGQAALTLIAAAIAAWLGGR